MKLKYILTTNIILLAFMFLGSQVVQAGIGISPANITNARLKPGSKYTEEFVLSSNDSDTDLSVSVEGDMGEANSWLSFEPGANFIIKKGTQRETIKITLSPPNDVELKDYKGFVRIKVSPVNNGNNGGIAVVQGARIDVSVTTSKLDFADLIIRSIKIEDTDTASLLKLNLKIDNKGNIPGSPDTVDIDVQDLNQKKIKTLSINTIRKVDPNRSEEVISSVEHGLPAGEYFGLVKVYFNNQIIREEKVVFKVTENLFASGPIVSTASPNVLIIALVLGGVVAIVLVWAVLKRKKGHKAVTPVPAVEAKPVKKPSKPRKRRKQTAALALLLAVGAIPVALSLRQPANPVQQVQGEIVQRDRTTAKYNVYESADFNSLIIYQATEGDKFDVINSKGTWYQVKLPNGGLGWIPLNSVKEATYR